jgi:tetratricopeptide (TPR) repeat protein
MKDGDANPMRDMIERLHTEHTKLRNLQAVPGSKRDAQWRANREALVKGVRSAFAGFDAQFVAAPQAAIVTPVTPTAFDETRARLLAQVDEAWEMSVSPAKIASGGMPDELFIGGGTTGKGTPRTAADFISPVAFTTIPGIPAGQDQAVSNIMTAGNRSGDSAITRNSIDAILNNPDPYEPPLLPSSTGQFPITPRIPERFAEPRRERPALKALQNAPEGADLEAIYFEWKAKAEHAVDPDFYFDAADFFLARGERKIGLRILGNLAELDPESAPLLRVVAHRYQQLDLLGEAEALFRVVKKLRDFEPQSWRDLALVLEKGGKAQEALELMWQTVERDWDPRFQEVQMTILNELNALVVRHGEPLELSAIDERFLRNLDCDLRVVLTWSTNETDVDLWVTDPLGERCFYQRARTASGGRISPDFTTGYGPEEFLIRKALPGEYKIEADYFGNSRQTLDVTTTVQVEIFRNWGRPNQTSEARTVRLESRREVLSLGVADLSDK